MNKDCFKHLPKFKKEVNEVVSTFKQSLSAIFQRIQRDFETIDCIKLQNNLQCLKSVKPLQKELKTEIFKFFLQKQLQQFNFLSKKTSLRILKLTKIKLQNYKLDWLMVWKDILERFPQVGRKSVVTLQQFMKVVKIFFDENNCMDVIKYFLLNHGEHNEYVFSYILIFANITDNTKEQIFNQFLQQLIECYYRGMIKSRSLIIYFINLMKKRKTNSFPQNRYALFNDIIMSSLITPPARDPKDSIQAKFTKQNAMMISQFVGKSNHNSIQLLTYIFKIVAKFINPFQNSSKAVRFLFNLIRFLWKRKQREQNANERLKKLIIKQKQGNDQVQKKKTNQQDKKQEEQETKSQQPKINANNQQKKQQEEDQDEQQQIQSQDQKQKQQILDQQLNQGEQDNIFNNIEQRKNKYYKILKNQLTQDITNLIKTQIQNIFQSIYFVNSVKTVPQFIRYSFMFAPNLILGSLDLLDKASQIPYINEEGLVLNIKMTAQYFMAKNIQKDSINNVMRVLQRIINCSKIRQVWPIYSIFCSKIPLLDQKDLQLVSSQDKQHFLTKFGLNHDIFYQNYSGNVLQAFKRLLRQGQFFDKQTSNEFSNSFEELYANSYKFYRKALLNQVIQIITENRKNQFVFKFFKQKISITPITQEIICQQLNLIGDNNLNQQNLEVRNNLVQILCFCKPLKDLKHYIREFANKNKYQVIQSYFIKRIQFLLLVQPLNTSLRHLFQKQVVKFKSAQKFEKRVEALNQMRSYSDQLLEELHQIIFTKQKDNDILLSAIKLIKEGTAVQTVRGRIYKMYCLKENQKLQFKNIEVRKKISQILMLILCIQERVHHQIIKINEQTLKFQIVPFQSQRKSLLQDQRFIQIMKALIFLKEDEYLHDQILMSNLSSIVVHEMSHNYIHEAKLQKQNMSKCGMDNNHKEIPGKMNRINAMEAFSSKIKVLFNYSMMNKCKKLTGNYQNSNIVLCQYIQIILNDLKILSFAPGNQKAVQMIKIFLSTSKMRQVQDFIMLLYNQDLDSRFYWERAFHLFDQLKNYGLNFSSEQIITLIKNHLKNLQSKHKKVKEISLKSFQNILSFLPHAKVNEIQCHLKQNLEQQKQQIVWLLMVNISLSSKIISRKLTQEQKLFKLNQISDFMFILQKLILSQTRIIRRLSLFLYSICFRKSKKLIQNSFQKTIQKQNLVYQQKDFNKFLQYGYLRNQHQSLKQQKTCQKIKDQHVFQKIQNIEKLRRLGPYASFQVSRIDKSKQNKCYCLFEKIQEASYNFLIKNQETLLKFLTTFHADMASTAQQLLSMAQQIYKPTQISDLAIRQLQQTFYYLKLKDLHYGRIQILFGQRFFKYLIQKDAKQQFKFMRNAKVKQLITKSLQNMQSLDNQALILVICINLLSGYQKSFDSLQKNARQDIQSLILLIFSEGISKFSGNVFKKLVLMIDTIKNKKSLQFMDKKTLSAIYDTKKNICRNATIYLAIHSNSLQKHIQVLKVIFDNQLELQNSFVNKLINSILTFAQKWPIDKSEAEKYKFINFQKLKQAGQLVEYTPRTYHYSNLQFNDYLISSFKKLVANEKQNNEILKVLYGMIINAINCYSHLFECNNNKKATIQLIGLIQQMMENKDQTQLIDLQQFQQNIKTIFTIQYENPQNFQDILKTTINFIKKLSSKRQVEYLSILAHRPYNFLKLSELKYDQVIYQFLDIEETNVNYKQLITNLSLMLSFRMVNIQKFVDLLISRHQLDIKDKQLSLQSKITQISKHKQAKSKVVLLYQAHQLSTLTLDQKEIDIIMKHSTKQKKNIWSREMLLMRGKKEYLDNEQTKTVWRSIKEFSNPYHYIA